MYKIIGGNGVEYGPVSADEVRRWVAEGRANGQTLARAEGTAEWKPISSFPEFADLAPASAPKAPGAAASDESARAQALVALRGPAIGLIVTAVAGFLIAIAAGILIAMSRSGYDFSTIPNMTPELLARLKALGDDSNLVIYFISLAGSIFVLFSALQMQRLKNYGLCVAACIVAMAPYLNFCCIIGLPIGIWGLVMLFKPEVRACFK